MGIGQDVRISRVYLLQSQGVQQKRRTHQAQFLGSEQRPNPFSGELSEIPFDDFARGEVLLLDSGRSATNLVQDVLTQPCLLSVLVCDPVNSSDSFRLSSLGQQEFRGLIEVKQEESASEHDKSHGTESEVQVSPTLALGSGAAWWSADVTRF